MMASWMHAASDKAKAIKSTAGVASYVNFDTKPVACLRARLRLGVALTPHRRFIYRQVLSPQCPRCDVVGSAEHVILHFGVARSHCIKSLTDLYFPALELVFGDPPPTPPSFAG